MSRPQRIPPFGAVLLVLVFLAGSVGLALFLRAPGDEQEEKETRYPSEWGWIQRTFPYYQADHDAYHTAWLQARALQTASKSGPFGTWEFAGPTNIGGRIVDVAFDPLHPDTIYAAAATGGVFKSIDAGQTWRPIFDEQPVLTIGDIAVDPSDPQVLYVGTGEANGGHNNFAGSGLYKSTDGGATWTFTGLAETTSIGRIRVHPTNPQRVFVAAVGSYFAANPERGLYRSDDAGQSWERVLFVSDTTGIVDFVMRPDNPDVLVAAAWERVRRPTGAVLSGPSSGLYRSEDGGDTWTRLDTTHGLPDGPAGRIGLAVCREVPDVMYALYTDGHTYMGLYRSDDGGVSWYDADPDDDLRGGFATFSWYFGQVRVHPSDPDRVFVLDLLLNTSPDGGATWTRTAGTHVDHHAMAFHPVDPNVLINGNDGGLALSDDGGVSWTKVAHLPVTQFYEIAVDPNNPERLYGGTQDNGTIRTLTGRPDDWHEILGADGFYVIVDPTDPNTIYMEIQWGGLYKSTDGGQSFAPATTGIPPAEEEPRNWSTPVVMAPDDPKTLYYGTNRIYRTEDGAASWTPISDDLTKQLGWPLVGTVSTIAVAPSSSDVIYAGTDDGNVWVSGDYGTTWENVTRDPLPFRWVTRVVVDPVDPDVAYVTFSGLKWRDPQPHVFRTTDRGQTWEDISSNLPDAPVNAFAVDPRNRDVLYAGTDVGAFVSLDAGTTWQALGSDLPSVSVYDLKLYDDGTRRFLVAGTHGRSMYRLDLSEVPTTTDEDPSLPEVVALEPAFPNPFDDRTTLQYTLRDPGELRLDVFDALGRRIRTLWSGYAPSGTHAVTWDGTTDSGEPAASGTYLARLTVTTTAGRHTRTVTLTRVR